MLVLFRRHASASLTIQENADPAVQADFPRFFDRLAADGPADEAHDAGGPDDMSAPIKSALTDVSDTISIIGGRLVLGARRGIFLGEHRAPPHRRQVAARAMGA